MKKTVKTLLTMLLVTSLLAGCTDGAVTARLAAADSLMADHPDSALALLDGMRAEKSGWAESQRMRHALLTAKAMNKAFVDFTTDSMMREVAAYYDSHGTANDRLLAHYLLGCTYRDLGEAPRAVDCFHDAIDAADTTASDCDYRTMGFAYSQMANVYHKQLLLTDEIESRRRASYYATLTRDTFLVLNSQKLSVGAYILLNKKDSAELIIKKVLERSYQNGYTQAALQSSTLLMHLYIDRPDKLSELKALIDNYEAKSKMFDEHHELPPSKRLYYFYKGKYFEGIHHYDSAEYYYRKISLSGVTSVALDPMYKGLLSVFTKRHQPDSIAKYAQLYCEANDSSIVTRDKNILELTLASFNYNRYKREALESENKYYQTLLLFIAITVCFAFFVAVILLMTKRYRQLQEKSRQKLIEEHHRQEAEIMSALQNATEEYNRKMEHLQALEETHRLANVEAEKTISELRSEKESYQAELSNVQKMMTENNAKYEQEKDGLTAEILSLSEKIKAYKTKLDITAGLNKRNSLEEESVIVKLREQARNPKRVMTEVCLADLEQTMSTYYPMLIRDLRMNPKFSDNDRLICILTALKFRSGDIVNLTGLTSSKVTNAKEKLNYLLFDTRSASSLLQNLINRYFDFSDSICKNM